MPDITRQVETQFTLTDKVTAPLQRMHAGAQRMTQMFDRATGVLAHFGAIAGVAGGAYAVGSSVIGAKNYLRTVQEISDAFGFQAKQVDSVLEAMFTVNIQAQEGRQVMEQMSLAMARTRMEVARAGVASSDAGRLITRLGVNLQNGPQAALIRMAELAQANKLSMTDLNIAFQIPQQTATKLITLLKQGPGEVTKIMVELQKRGLAVNAQNVAAFKEYQAAQLRAKSAWDRIWIVVTMKVMPTVTRLMDSIADKFDAWSEKAGVWGERVVGFLEKHLSLVVSIGKVMLANMALQKIAGFGLGGAATRVGGVVGRLLGLGAKAAKGPGEAASAVVKAMTATPVKIVEISSSAALMIGTGIRKPGSLVEKAAAAVKPTAAVPKAQVARITSMMRGLPMILARVGAVVARFTVVGVIITTVIAFALYAVKAVRANVEGIRDYLLDLWRTMQARVLVIWDILRPIFNWVRRLFSSDGIVGKFFLWLVPRVIRGIGDMVNSVLTTIQTIVLFIREMATNFRQTLMHPLETFERAANEAQRRTVAKKLELEIQGARDFEEQKRRGRERAPGTRPPPPVYDFSGSRFDIKQQFAEGFDPDRIAVAFSNDLATLGERRVQSGLAPLFAVR